MIRVNPFHWTADFRLARALAEAYQSSGRPDVCFLCVGDPDDLVGQLGPLVADETIKYYPNVLGTSDRPVTHDTLEQRIEELFERWPDAFIIGIEAGFGPSHLLGSIEITDRDLTTLPIRAGRFNDLTVNVLLRVDEMADLRHGAARTVRRSESPGAPGLEQAAKEVGSDEPMAASPFGREKFKPLRPEAIDVYKVRKLADTVIDGNLRLLSRIGKQEI